MKFSNACFDLFCLNVEGGVCSKFVVLTDIAQDKILKLYLVGECLSRPQRPAQALPCWFQLVPVKTCVLQNPRQKLSARYLFFDPCCL